MADRDELKSRLSAFGELPLPSRLHMFSDTGNRESQNIEDRRGTTVEELERLYWPAATQGQIALMGRLLGQMRDPPWRKSVGEHIQGAGNMLPDLDLRRNFAEGGTVDDILSAYSAPVRSWPGEQALDDEARANYAAMHPEPKKLRPDESYRGMFLPFRETTEGKHEWAVPGIFMDPADAAKAIYASSGTSLGAMARPSQLSPEALDEILGIGGAGALTGIMGNMPRVLAKPSTGMTELGIFGGRSAKTADHAMLAKAEDMAAQGVPREKIWSDTGWFQGADGKWRFEIDDSQAVFNGGKGRFRDVIGHDALYDAYPDLGKVKTDQFGGLASLFARAAYNEPEPKWFGLSQTAPKISYSKSLSPDDALSVLLHEGQHNIQNVEGFGRGSRAHGEADSLSPDVLKMVRNAETERLAQRRFDLEESMRPKGFDNNNPWDIAGDILRRPGLRDMTPEQRIAEAIRMLDKSDLDFGRQTDVYRKAAQVIRDGTPRPQRRPEVTDMDRMKAASEIDRAVYDHTAGEVEARAVQSRLNLTPDERRSRPPWLDYDVPESQQIVRMRD